MQKESLYRATIPRLELRVYVIKPLQLIIWKQHNIFLSDHRLLAQPITEVDAREVRVKARYM
jgi:hypothetical protein